MSEESSLPKLRDRALGIVATGTDASNAKIYFNDDNDNDHHNNHDDDDFLDHRHASTLSSRS